MRSFIESLIPVSQGDPYAMLKSFSSHTRDAINERERFWESGLVPLLIIFAWLSGEVIVWALRKTKTPNSKTPLKRWRDN